MKVLVIPDVHLKPEMFYRASEIMRQGIADRAVCLMDIADDWNKQYDIDLYEETYDAAISFAKKYPETFWCYGNHDVSYIWHMPESGYSSMASATVQKKLMELKEILPENNPIKYVQRIDNVLFSHAGVGDYFVSEYVPEEKYDNVDEVIDIINSLGANEMWNDASPIWLRPQDFNIRMYKGAELLQVVGHTPVEEIIRENNIISCDTFSTYSDGGMIGTEEYLVLDTESWECQRVKR